MKEKDAPFMKHFDQVHEIACKSVRALPPDKLDLKPTPEMMSAKELAFHMLATEKAMLKAVKTGKLVLDDFKALDQDMEGLGTPEALAAYGERIHAETNRWFESCPEEEYARPVEVFWGGEPMTPFLCLAGTEEHMLHHRGQLCVYLRLAGVVPPSAYGE
jgi:uncharacterized damage-inducible protein DinB